ncbi:MAG TPA: hypothetical protein P5077_07375 [bacterium]|nr:hypothetical protein [bacterium]
MLISSILIFVFSLGLAAVGWFGLADLVGQIPGAILGFCSFFVPGIYFVYENMKENRKGAKQESDESAPPPVS